ncbi:MAG: DUF1573 domain-containing protein [Candidatus Liptonbacteria bacterium]|nr:DUF1573 domain-containing protein [Candidatus Liptonbacteria bacterium]MBI3114521.1 DUF1573 domain-containing protein [Candidatus Harrisonbacteria bacterium]
MENSKNIIIGVAFAVVVVWALFFWGGGEPRGNQTANIAPTGESALRADMEQFSFGSVSMKKGNVSHEYKVKNTGSVPVRVTKMYTSCMCTTAKLAAASGQAGPFGMPGHGFVPRIDVSIAPGEEAAVEAIFDPNAHGPAGIGRIERVVYLETDDGAPVELAFSADVTP